MNITRNQKIEKKAQEKLMPLIPFTEADLAANDDGFFTAQQQQRLKPKTDLYIALSSIGAFLGFISGLVFFYVGGNGGNYIFPTGFCLMVFGISCYGVVWSLTLAKRVKSGFGVKKAEGVAGLYIDFGGKDKNVPVYNLVIQNIKFQLNEETYNAFETGFYCVYYFPMLRNELLSVEPAD